MIIYIHGFGGSGQGSKAKLFREYFKSIDESFIAPHAKIIVEEGGSPEFDGIEKYFETVCTYFAIFK